MTMTPAVRDPATRRRILTLAGYRVKYVEAVDLEARTIRLLVCEGGSAVRPPRPLRMPDRGVVTVHLTGDVRLFESERQYAAAYPLHPGTRVYFAVEKVNGRDVVKGFVDRQSRAVALPWAVVPS